MKIFYNARLQHAEKATEEGRYEDALHEYLDIHKDAEERRRVEYITERAVADLIGLGEVYPKAKEALQVFRDHDIHQLKIGEGDCFYFQFVAAINEYLQEEQSTCALFQSFDIHQPALAAQCASIALPVLVRNRDYALARRYLKSDLLETVRDESESLNGLVDLTRRATEGPYTFDYVVRDPLTSEDADALHGVFTKGYVERIKMILLILTGTGEYEEAGRIREAATQMVKSPSIRKSVRDALLTWQQQQQQKESG